MREPKHFGRWVVYLMNVSCAAGQHAVCQQSEWDQMELANPGYHTLVRSGIATEGEAETLARAGLIAAELTKAAEQKNRRQGRKQFARDAR